MAAAVSYSPLPSTRPTSSQIRHHRSFSRPFAAPSPPLTFESIPLPPGTSISTSSSSPSSTPPRHRARHHLRLRHRLPTSIPPTAVIALLHTHHPLITSQPFVTSYLPLPIPSAAALRDPFFHRPPPGPSVSSSLPPPIAYRITEKVPILPKLYSHTLTLTSTFQSLPTGLRVRAEAPASVTLWIEYHVVRIRAEDSTDKRGTIAAWELVEVVTIEAQKWMMGFVARSAEEAQRELCRKIVEGLSQGRPVRERSGSVRELKAMRE